MVSSIFFFLFWFWENKMFVTHENKVLNCDYVMIFYMMENHGQMLFNCGCVAIVEMFKTLMSAAHSVAVDLS